MKIAVWILHRHHFTSGCFQPSARIVDRQIPARNPLTNGFLGRARFSNYLTQAVDKCSATRIKLMGIVATLLHTASIKQKDLPLVIYLPSSLASFTSYFCQTRSIEAYDQSLRPLNLRYYSH